MCPVRLAASVLFRLIFDQRLHTVLRPRVPGWFVFAHGKPDQLGAVRTPDVDAIDVGPDDFANCKPDGTSNRRSDGSADRKPDREPDQSSNRDPNG